MTKKKIQISVIIHALNEEQNLPFTINSIKNWADEIFLVDSQSTDKTREIALENGLIVYNRECTRAGLTEQRNWALDNLPFSNEWVFIVDADEVVEDTLKLEIEDILLKTVHLKEAYLVRFKNIFLGKWIKHSSMYPSWTMRLFKHKLIRYEKREANAHPIVDKNKVGYLKGHLLNWDRRKFSYNLKRIDEFSDLESKAYLKVSNGEAQSDLLEGNFFGNKLNRRRYVKNFYIKLPFKPILIFLYLYVIRLGFLDGKAGLNWAFYKMVCEWATSIKMKELKK